MRIKLLFLVAWLALAGPAFGQFRDPASEFTRKNPKFMAIFKGPVAQPSASTVRVLSGGKEVALGVVVGAEGWILTKANDLGTGLLAVRVSSKTYDAELVGVHVPHDLALLKIDAHDLPTIEFKDSKVADVGSWIACVGPDSQPVAVGVISVATRNMTTKGFVPPPNTNAAYLGVELDPAEGGGVKIKAVMPKAPAERSGFKANDVILLVAGKQADTPDEFRKALSKYKPGDVVKFKIRRGEDEMEKSAALDRPPPNSIGDQQNKMGSELSSRRSGYGTILQHDSVVKPADCGGPIVDLEGRVLGINICRAGRVESWAVPSEVIRPVLADMMAGKLPPPKGMVNLTPDQKLEKAQSNVKRIEADKSREKDLADARKALREAEAEVKAIRKKEAAEVSDRLLALMQQRLVLMNDVAAWKWNHRQETHDPVRESESLAKLLPRAKNLGVDSKNVERFFKAQFEASRLLQEERMAGWAKDEKLPKASADLNADLRPKIEKLNVEMIEMLAQTIRYWNDGDLGVAARVQERSPQVIAGKGISDAVRAKALEGLPGR